MATATQRKESARTHVNQHVRSRMRSVLESVKVIDVNVTRVICSLMRGNVFYQMTVQVI